MSYYRNRYVCAIGVTTILAMLAVVFLAYRSAVRTSQLHEAVVRSDIQELDRLLNAGNNIDELNRGEVLGIGIRTYPMRFEDSVTPLFVAVGESNPAIVSFLLNKGANVTVGGGYDSPLHFAIICLEPSIDFDIDDAPSKLSVERPFDREASIEVIRLLIAHGADVNYRRKVDSESPLEICERLREYEIREKMQKWFCEYNEKN